jgi:hypothetical protein
MKIVEIIAIGFATLVIVATVWNLVRNGIARSNGKRPEFENEWMGADVPPDL